MNFNAQSPYSKLSDSLFGQQAMARGRAGASSQAAGAADVNRLMRPQGGGTTRNLFDATNGLGAAAANRSVAPLAQRISDSQTNAEWLLNKQNANEQFGNAMFGRLANNWASNNDPGRRWQMLRSSGLMDSLFS